MGARNNHRRLTFALSTLSLLSNGCLAYLFYNLPDDPLHFARHLGLYSCFAAGLSLLGIIGAKKGNATMVQIFANYLLLDIVICTVPRIMVMNTLPDIRDSICSADAIQVWLEAAQDPDTVAAAQTVSKSQQLASQCQRAVGFFSFLVIAFSIGWTVIQLLLVLRVSTYARMLQRESRAIDAVEFGADRQQSVRLVETVPVHHDPPPRYQDEPSEMSQVAQFVIDPERRPA